MQHWYCIGAVLPSKIALRTSSPGVPQQLALPRQPGHAPCTAKVAACVRALTYLGADPEAAKSARQLLSLAALRLRLLGVWVLELLA